MFQKAQEAKEKSEDVQIKENMTLSEYEGIMNGYVDGTRDTVTIDREEYELLIPSPIGENSLLMSSINTSKAKESLNLTSFTNTFSESYEDYFSYDSNTGELICKKAGWYIVKLELRLDNQNSQSTTTYVRMFINNIDIGNVRAVCSAASTIQSDCNTITFYIRPGEKLNFSKETSGGPAYWQNDVSISLFKM